MSKSIFFNPHCVKVTLAEKEVVPLSLSFTLCEARYVVYLLSLISLCTQWRGTTLHLSLQNCRSWGLEGQSVSSALVSKNYYVGMDIVYMGGLEL